MADASASGTVLEVVGVGVTQGPSRACVRGTDRGLIPFGLWRCSPSSSARRPPAQRVASLASPEQKLLARPVRDAALLGAGCPALEQRHFEFFLPATCGLVTTQSPAGLTPSHCLTSKRKLSEIHSVK